MRQTLTLYSGEKQLIRTTSPEQILDIEAGEYPVDVSLREQLSALWPMDEYMGSLILEVTNG
jgi:hypothetical protein